MLEIYQEVLGLVFCEVFSQNIWHEDVKIYEVQDAKTNELIGHFYLDLFPREGKYTHAACFGLQPGCVTDVETGKRQYPVAAMVRTIPFIHLVRPNLA